MLTNELKEVKADWASHQEYRGTRITIADYSDLFKKPLFTVEIYDFMRIRNLELERKDYPSFDAALQAAKKAVDKDLK